MYATCLFCNRALGQNESLESFPIGRRLAFDAAKGRLWVVCHHCERWNLSPLEQRWEAIEQAEKLYAVTRLRASTDQIGLAKLRDGTELVRIGAPQRPELAAWRYGDQFGRRRRRQLLIAGAGVTALGAVVIGGVVAGASIGGFIGAFSQLGRVMINGSPEAVIARLPLQDHDTAGRDEMLVVKRKHLAETRIRSGIDGPLAIDLRHRDGTAHFDGARAARIAAQLMPKVNRFGGAPGAVTAAVSQLEEAGGVEGYLVNLARLASALTRPSEKGRSWRSRSNMEHGLFGLPPVQRLALEMALHEDAERRALGGELALLELAWREAEEIAAISDNLLVPSSVSRSLESIRRRLPGGT